MFRENEKKIYIYKYSSVYENGSCAFSIPRTTNEMPYLLPNKIVAFMQHHEESKRILLSYSSTNISDMIQRISLFFSLAYIANFLHRDKIRISQVSTIAFFLKDIAKTCSHFNTKLTRVIFRVYTWNLFVDE